MNGNTPAIRFNLPSLWPMFCVLYYQGRYIYTQNLLIKLTKLIQLYYKFVKRFVSLFIHDPFHAWHVVENLDHKIESILLKHCLKLTQD